MRFARLSGEMQVTVIRVLVNFSGSLPAWLMLSYGLCREQETWTQRNTMTIEIPQHFWAQFFERVSAQDDLLIDIRIEKDGDLRLLAHSVPLQALIFEVGDACNNTLTIAFGPARERTLRYQIVEPIRLILRKETEGDHYHLLEIPAESGTTIIHFRPGIGPAVLGDLEHPQLRPVAR